MKYFKMAGNSICLLLVVFVCTGANPHRRTGEDCEEASQALKQLLENHDDWFGGLHMGSVTFDYMYEGITGTTLDEFPDDFFCAFNGLESVDDLLLRLQLTGYLQAPFEFAYNYLTGSALYGHQYVLMEIADPNPWSNLTELRVYDKLLTDLEASGIMSLNPDGFLWFYGTIGINEIDELPDYFPTGDAISTDDVTEQAIRIANDIRKVWNMLVQQIGQYRPDAGQFVRDELERWTGIHLEQGAASHNMIITLVDDIIEASRTDDPMSGLLDLFLNRGVIRHAMNAAYPDLLHVVTDYEHALENTQNTDGQGYGYGGPNYGYNGPSYGSDGSNYGYGGPGYVSHGSNYGYDGSNYGSHGPSNGSDGSNYGSDGSNYGSDGSNYGSDGPSYGSDGSSNGQGQPDYGYAGYGYNYNSGPSQETLELIYQVIQALRGMGLFDLSYN